MNQKLIKCETQEEWDFVRRKYNRPPEKMRPDLYLTDTGAYNAWDINFILTTFQEWLDDTGYNKDWLKHSHKSEFILPEKWCFTTTEESHEIFIKWYNRPNADKSIGNHYWSDNGIVTGWMYYAKDRKLGYTEITFDQFKKYVLKEEEEDLTGRYLKALTDRPQSTPFSKGSVVKIIKKRSATSYELEKGWVFITSNSNAHKWELLPKDYCVAKPKFEVGKWYKILGNWYAKSKSIHNSGRRWKFSERISSEGHYFPYTDSIDLISQITLVENLNEIQQYLPEGHVDKIKQEFKVGDWVTYTNPDGIIKHTCKIKEWGPASYCKLEGGKEPFKSLLRHATQSEIDAVSNPTLKEQSIKELLEYAKKKYPVGTRFVEPRFNKSHYIVEDTKQFRIHHGAICIQNDGNGTIYHKGKWAGIVSRPEEGLLTVSNSWIEAKEKEFIEEWRAQGLSIQIISHKPNLLLDDSENDEVLSFTKVKTSNKQLNINN